MAMSKSRVANYPNEMRQVAKVREKSILDFVFRKCNEKVWLGLRSTSRTGGDIPLQSLQMPTPNSAMAVA
ncbi:hypothetical protein N8639_00150 [bacterium]|jgi:hypothetical protein|nr:hypothetical protein [bacterium]